MRSFPNFIAVVALSLMVARPVAAQQPNVSLSIREAEASEPRLARWAGREMKDLQTGPPSAPPTSGYGMTMAEIESAALRHHPTLVQAARRLEAARGKHLQAGLWPNPTLGYIAEEMNDDGRAGQQGMFFGQQITTGGKLRRARAAVSHEVAMARQELAIQRHRVINDARMAAYSAMGAQRSLDIAEQLMQIGQEGKKVAEDLLKAQEVSRVDVLQARIEANTARLQRDEALSDVAATWRRLAIAMGTPGLATTRVEDRLDGELPELVFDDALARLLAASPELARARSAVSRAECELARQCAERVPNVDFEGSVRYNTASEETVASVGIGVPLRIFDRNQGNIYRARAELGAAQQEVRRVELSLRDRLAEAFREHAVARQRTDHYRQEILPDAKDSLELVQEGYRRGEFGYLELLTAQRTYFRANLAYVAALESLWSSHTKIDGLLLTGGLEPLD